MIKLLSVNVFVFVMLLNSMPAQAQRAKTLEGVIRALSHSQAMSVCRTKGGNLVEKVDDRPRVYKCWFDTKTAQLEELKQRLSDSSKY